MIDDLLIVSCAGLFGANMTVALIGNPTPVTYVAVTITALAVVINLLRRAARHS